MNKSYTRTPFVLRKDEHPLIKELANALWEEREARNAVKSAEDEVARLTHALDESMLDFPAWTISKERPFPDV